MSASDLFTDLFGAGRGRPKRRRRRRPPGERRSLQEIASDSLHQPQDPAAIRALAAELRERDRWFDTPVREQPLLRLAIASLIAGAQTAYEQRPPARSQAGRAEAQTRRLALADARVLLADLVDECSGDWRRVLISRGAQLGVARGQALARHRRTLAEDRELLRAAADPVDDDPPPAA